MYLHRNSRIAHYTTAVFQYYNITSLTNIPNNSDEDTGRVNKINICTDDNATKPKFFSLKKAHLLVLENLLSYPLHTDAGGGILFIKKKL